MLEPTATRFYQSALQSGLADAPALLFAPPEELGADGAAGLERIAARAVRRIVSDAVLYRLVSYRAV